MKFTHKVFHLDGDESRDSAVVSINEYMSSYSKLLVTPTIRISNKDQYDYFLQSNPGFTPDPYGYSLNGEQGWRFGEIGIWASNWTAWNNFLKSDADYLILMEDDITYSNSFMEIIINYMYQLPEGWEAFHAFAPADQFGKYKAAEKMIAYSSNFNLPLDWYMFRQKHIFNVYTIKPSSEFPCTLLPTESTFQTTQKREVI